MFYREAGDPKAPTVLLRLPAIAAVDEEIPIGNGLFHLRHAGEALHPEHESLAALERLRREVGSDVFAASNPG